MKSEGSNLLNFEKTLFSTGLDSILNTQTGNLSHTILIVDDEDHNLQLLKRTFRGKYNILTAKNGEEGLKVLEENLDQVALIISDHKMPIMEGTQFLEHANKIAPGIVKILLTGYTDVEILTDAVNKCNLFQYIVKPYEPQEVERAVEDGLEKFDLSNSKSLMLKDLKELFYRTIKSIASALDSKDTYTHGHSVRVTLYSLILGKELGLGPRELEDIETAGLLHDIGKIAIPQSILCKPGKLTDDEFKIMKLHPENSERLVMSIKKLNGISSWLRTHHERWDGRGYPNGLKGEEIPLSARIIALADTYDAMTSTRSYRVALSHQTAIEEIQRCAGGQFDPELAQRFVALEATMKAAKENPDKYYKEYSYLQKEIDSIIG